MNRDQARADAALARKVREKAGALAEAIDAAVKAGLSVNFNVGPDPQQGGKVTVTRCDISRIITL